MSPYRKDINAFAVTCEALLSVDIVSENLNEIDNRLVQYYIAALAAKFPVRLT